VSSTLSRQDRRLRNSPNGSDSPRSPHLGIDAVLARTPGPTRMCRVCRKRLPKAQLTRWVRGAGAAVRDPTQTLPGRGYYTCSDACATKLPTTINHTKR
jgi:hypothetical protein